jgi:hypothetical protein
MWSYFDGNIQEPLDFEAGGMKILLDGKESLVGYNLWAALNYYRNAIEHIWSQKPSVYDEYNIWADALCIDQGNILERNAQVRRMREIYMKAHNVGVWLGQEAHQSQLAMKLLTDPERPLMSQTPLTETGLENEKKWITSSIADGSKKQAWLALTALYQRPYWKRVWILQEIFSNDRISVICGSHWAGWTTFVYVALYLYSKLPQAHPTHPLYSNTLALEILQAVPNIRLFMAGAGFKISDFASLPLHDLLGLYGYHECTDPRDKVYGLLGLTREEFFEENNLPIDYNVSVDTLYTFVAAAIILEKHRLEYVLRHAEYSNRELFHIPTWTPSWHEIHPPRTITFLLDSALRADAEQFKTPKFSHDWKIMSVEGLYIGKIEDLMAKHLPIGETDDFDEPLLMEFLSEMLNFVLPKDSPARRALINDGGYDTEGERETPEKRERENGIKRIMMFYQLLFETQDVVKGMDPPPSRVTYINLWMYLLRNPRLSGEGPEDGDEVVAKIFSFTRGRAFFKTKVLSMEDEEDIEATSVEPSGENSSSELQEDSELPNITSMTISTEHQPSGEIPCPALTDQEKYTPVYGVCSTSAKRNDIVAILHGCSVPVILREDEHELGSHTLSTFVACAYIAGYMHGEAVGKFETRTFRIR